MKYCIYCGNKLNSENKYCNNCGKRLKKKHTNRIITITVFVVIGVLILPSLVNGIIKYKKYRNEQDNYYKNIRNIVQNNLYSEIVSDNYNLHLNSSENCIRCSTNCDGSCFSYEKDKNCMIFEYTVNDSDLEYKAYLVEKKTKTSKRYAFFSSRAETSFYNNILARAKKDFSEFKIESKFEYSVLDEDETSSSECGIDLYTSKSFKNVFDEELYNKLVAFSNDRIGKCAFGIHFDDDKEIYFMYKNNSINIYNKIDDRFRLNGNDIETDNITYEEFMLEVGNRGW